MAELIYTSITSLDGYIADEDGEFAWGAPDSEVFAFRSPRMLAPTQLPTPTASS